MLDVLDPLTWPTFVLVSARVAGLAVTAPLWALRSVPRSVKGAFAVVLTIALLPLAPPLQGDVEILVVPIALAAELLIGVAIGLSAGVLLYAVQVAAEVISTQMGLSIAGTLAPTMSGSTPGMGELKTMMALAMYVTLGGHLVLLQGLGASLHAIRPGSGIALTTGAPALVDLVGSLFGTAVRVAAPIMVALLLTNVALAVLGKAVPQLNVLMLAFPITIGLGLIVFGASIPVLGSVLASWIDGLPYVVDRLIGALTPAGAVP